MLLTNMPSESDKGRKKITCYTEKKKFTFCELQHNYFVSLQLYITAPEDEFDIPLGLFL